jgi:hypothetical protein
MQGDDINRVVFGLENSKSTLQDFVKVAVREEVQIFSVRSKTGAKLLVILVVRGDFAGCRNKDGQPSRHSPHSCRRPATCCLVTGIIEDLSMLSPIDGFLFLVVNVDIPKAAVLVDQATFLLSGDHRRVLEALVAAGDLLFIHPSCDAMCRLRHCGRRRRRSSGHRATRLRLLANAGVRVRLRRCPLWPGR